MILILYVKSNATFQNLFNLSYSRRLVWCIITKLYSSVKFM